MKISPRIGAEQVEPRSNIAARWLAVVAAAASIFVGGCASTPKVKPVSYASAEAAVDALVAAMRSDQMSEVARVLGPGSEKVVMSGDPVEDSLRDKKFLEAYDQKHELVADGPDTKTLVIGIQDWPMPIPLVQDGGSWRFDVEEGIEEILSRRIGRNELDVIQVCMAIGDAQREYAETDGDKDGWHNYAEKFVSDEGKRNGLYWPTAPGEPLSPLGELAAEASVQGYATTANPTNKPRPFHGYCYRILKEQGPDAPGGACSYVVNGRMIGGFAVVAYPAEYGNSGIMTFIMNHTGVVYQSDLGPDTEREATKMKAFNPGDAWTPVQQ